MHIANSCWWKIFRVGLTLGKSTTKSMQGSRFYTDTKAVFRHSGMNLGQGSLAQCLWVPANSFPPDTHQVLLGSRWGYFDF